MSISQNFPEIKPSFVADFANTKRLDPRITFARASEGRYYDGVTTAKAEENLLPYSQNYGAGTSWFNIGSATSGQLAPDGTSTAFLMTATAQTAVQAWLGRNQSYSSGTVTVSVFAKAGTHSFIQIGVFSNSAYANVDISTGTIGTVVGGTASIQPVSNGYFRIVFTIDSVSGNNGLVIYNIDSLTDARNPSTTTVGTETVYFWGAQVEQRSSVTAYTPTTTQPITNYIPVLQTASANVARFDHNPTTGESLGLLVEEQRTNLLTYSEDFADASWGKGFAGTGVAPVVTVNQGIAPDGTLSADQIVFNAGAGTTTTDQSILTKSLTVSAIDYSASFWLKTLSGTATLLFRGVAASSYAVITVTDQWQRFSRTELGLAGTGNRFELGIRQGLSGIGVINSAATILLWGAQVEAGAFPTSYIPTVASQVTRSADSASMTGENFSSWFSNAEGTIYSEYSTKSSTSIYAYSLGTYTNGIYFRPISGQNMVVRKNNTTQAQMGATAFSNDTYYKQIGSYAFNDIATCVNSGTVATDTSSEVPEVSALYFAGIGSGTAGSLYFKKLAFYPKALTATNLQALTS